jgi:hypothetical protein
VVRGRWGKRFRSSRRSRGGRSLEREGLRRRVDGEQRRAARLRGVATVFRWPECQRAAGKWLESFLGVMWCWWCAWPGLRGGAASGRRRDRAAAELELTGAVVRAA